MDHYLGEFPRVRLRRNRRDEWSRRMVEEHHLTPSDLVWPVFVQEGKTQATDIAAMPCVKRYSVDALVKQVEGAVKLGIPAVAIFPVVPSEKKSLDAKEAWNRKNLICRAVQAIKKEKFDIGVICDVALDPYTTHGHDGLVKRGDVVNDETVRALVKQAIVQAEAGCDIVAPSDMMDGRVAAIRDALDEKGFQHVRILSYAAKYASSFYGPFREAVGSKQSLGKGHKKTYQMNPANSDEALREVAMDIHEGADMVMVKPGMPYLDIISRIRQAFHIPVFAYQVSGEYAMIKAAGEKGWFDDKAAMYESLIAFKRAGATGVLTYAAKEMATLCHEIKGR
jgi:porphobilinogen synthase